MTDTLTSTQVSESEGIEAAHAIPAGGNGFYPQDRHA